jgi:sulfotransferase family protein
MRNNVRSRRSPVPDHDPGAAGPLPTFLIIGGMKAGTTSLYHYVREHPQVFMPRYKAVEFFAGGVAWDRGIAWYRKQFAAAPPTALAIGEAANVYAKFPRYGGVPERIAAHIPDARLLYVIRDPIERIRSHYQHRVSEGREDTPFERAVVENPIYVGDSSYAMQIERYLEHFPREQLLVILNEDLRADRAPTMRRVYEFLGVDTDWVSPDLDREFFQTTDRPSRSLVPPGARKLLKRYIPAAKRAKELEANVLRRVRSIRPGGAGDPARSVKPDVSPELRARLIDALVDDVRRLRGILGPGFDGWDIA